MSAPIDGGRGLSVTGAAVLGLLLSIPVFTLVRMLLGGLFQGQCP